MEFRLGEKLHYIKASGSHYDVGFQIGRVKREGIQNAIRSYLYLTERLVPYVHTKEGKDNYDIYLNTVQTVYPQYVRELEGIADGAEVDFMKLMLLNLEPEFCCLLGDTPPCNESSESTHYPGTDGCTDIYLQCSHTNTNLLVHTEDNAPELLEAAVLIDATINNDDGSKAERFIGFTVAGLLVGSMFGINSYGLMNSANAVFQKDINLEGIPRRFLLRDMVTAKDLEEIKSITKTSKGIASAYNINVMQKTDGSSRNSYIYRWMEMAASDEGTIIKQHSPCGLHVHVNIFNHLCVPHYIEESSLRRKYKIDKVAQKLKPTTKKDILDIISNQDDAEFPVFRSGAKPDYLANNVTALFDLNEQSMAVYLSVPNKNEPVAIINATHLV